MDDSNEVLRLRDAELVWREVEGEIVILHQGDWEYLTVNETGALLWGKLVDGATRGQLVASLLAQYELDEQRAASDVEAFLDVLSERGLLSADVDGDASE